MNILAGIVGVGVATLLFSSTPDPRSTPGHILDVFLPLPVAECKCNATLGFTPDNGILMCPAPQGSLIGMQVIWQTPNPAKGNCQVVLPDGEGGPSCEDISNSECAGNVAPLDVVVYNCWAGGIFLTATGLQSGQRFFFSNETEAEFAPDMKAICKKAASSSKDVYEIEVYDAPSGSNLIAAFKITLTCDPCLVQ